MLPSSHSSKLKIFPNLKFLSFLVYLNLTPMKFFNSNQGSFNLKYHVNRNHAVYSDNFHMWIKITKKLCLSIFLLKYDITNFVSCNTQSSDLLVISKSRMVLTCGICHLTDMIFLDFMEIASIVCHLNIDYYSHIFHCVWYLLLTNTALLYSKGLLKQKCYHNKQGLTELETNTAKLNIKRPLIGYVL